MRKKPASTPKKDAFTSAAQKALDAKAREAAEVRIGQQRTLSRADVLRKAQDAFYDQYLSPMIEKLEALPEKDGNKFTVEGRYSGSDEKPRLVLSIDYNGPGYRISPYLSSHDAGLRKHVMIVMDDFLDADQFCLRICRSDLYGKDIHNGNGTYKTHVTIPVVASVEQMQAELGKWVAAVAPDRVQELVAAGKTKPVKKPAPKKPR